MPPSKVPRSNPSLVEESSSQQIKRDLYDKMKNIDMYGSEVVTFIDPSEEELEEWNGMLFTKNFKSSVLQIKVVE